MVSEHTTNIDSARLLIDAGADVNALNKVRLYSLTHQNCNCWEFTLVWLTAPQYGWSPLHDAAQECNVMAVGYFSECGADVNIADKVTMVHYAA